ncbi:MAG: RimK/LysX family protein [Thermoanaerobaculia bacterium]|nr:RimK/LysX family protein [Thermoanaerobaculia bacterium]
MILGWREWVALPEIGIDAVHAKLDTGARSSALHIVELETFRRQKANWVRFWVDPDPKHPDWIVECEAPVADERMVKNSGGRGQMRVVIRTMIDVAGRQWPIDLTLTSRSEMRFRMLIGREAMRDRILVDAMRSDLAGVPESRRRKTKKAR